MLFCVNKWVYEGKNGFLSGEHYSPQRRKLFLWPFGFRKLTWRLNGPRFLTKV
jgi:hypothetical protein